MAELIKNLKTIKVSKPRGGIDMPVAEYPIFAPNFSINEKQMPEIKDWETGEKYLLVIEVSMSSKSDRKGEPVRGDFDITRYKALSGKMMEDMTDEEMEEMQAKGLSS